MLIGVDVDPGESVDRISSWAESNGFFWPLAPVSADPLKDYRVSQQSAAVGIDASGEIVLRKNGGLQGEDRWRDWLTTLAGRDGIGGARGSVDGGVRTGRACASRGCSNGRYGSGGGDRRACHPARPARADCGCRGADSCGGSSHCGASAVRGSRADYYSVTDSDGEACTDCDAVTDSHANAQATAALGSEVGNRAHDFTVTAVNGETYTLSEVNASGKAVIVYFFATW